MLEFERIDDALSIHGTEVRYVTVSKTGAITGRVVASKNGVSLSGKFPTLLNQEEVELFQLTLRKAARIRTMLRHDMCNASNIPSEEELEQILAEERVQPTAFEVEIPRQAIAESDWGKLDEEEALPLHPDLTITDVIVDDDELLGDEDGRNPDEYLAEL